MGECVCTCVSEWVAWPRRLRSCPPRSCYYDSLLLRASMNRSSRHPHILQKRNNDLQTKIKGLEAHLPSKSSEDTKSLQRRIKMLEAVAEEEQRRSHTLQRSLTAAKTDRDNESEALRSKTR
eukprot:GHVU01070270.1.p1 GENE.GHVU01070270.1~~GHVU01070270.1.p1  ORF type:complete len:122 (-),score=11.65 GHVU01070270.1:108-473(-)